MRAIEKKSEEYYYAKDLAKNVIQFTLNDPNIHLRIFGLFDIRKECIWSAKKAKLYFYQGCYILIFNNKLCFKWSI